MPKNNVAQKRVVIKIKLVRRGHAYNYSRWRDGVQEIKENPIARESADRIIRAWNNGLIPPGMSLDITTPASWIWVKELHEDDI